MTKIAKVYLAITGLGLAACIGGGAFLASADSPDVAPTPPRVAETLPAIAPESTNEIGPGTWVVGSEVEAGSYRTSGAAGALCYWHTAKDDTDETIDQQGVISEPKQPGRVTLKKGQYFKTSGCEDWILQKK